jgi:succinoglycan biosynthesis protein ExoM
MATGEVSVCIPTYRRPLQLERSLMSLVDQQDAPPFKVVVVDNDDKRSAESVVTSFLGRLPLLYLVEPIRGLAKARNRCVAVSTTKFLAFIDDDEWASPRWLAELYRIAQTWNASAVIGTRHFSFGEDVPDFIKTCGLFDRRLHADGEPIPWFHCRGGNCLLRREDLPIPVDPFSASFDLTGGEDTQLFRSMIDAGATIVGASQAITIEYRFFDRANLFWVLRRSFRIGGTIVEVDWKGCNWKTRLRRGWDACLEGAHRGGKTVSSWHRDKAMAMQDLVRSSQEFGKVFRLFGGRIKEYRDH